ncbi:hypothetical protein [Corynebacterium vitaeruminis]|uniref:hypothetical protein n=1 Tax=Corynebacterium vitaeruminis TaxID=38305 RepID=UPI0023F37AC4|nr:hypothetical protein [Corynebacterium vitaeruminis]
MNIYQRKTLESLKRTVDLRLERYREELKESEANAREAIVQSAYHTHAYERGFKSGLLAAIWSLEITQSRLNDILNAGAETD